MENNKYTKLKWFEDTTLGGEIVYSAGSSVGEDEDTPFFWQFRLIDGFWVDISPEELRIDEVANAKFTTVEEAKAAYHKWDEELWEFYHNPSSFSEWMKL